MRIGYLCKYAPIEILLSMGAEVERIMPDVTDFNQADTLMHSNMCSFIKGVLEEISLEGTEGREPYDGLILTHCCDSTRRLYDVLKHRYPEKFIYMIDVPRTTGGSASEFFADCMTRFIADYEKFSGEKFDADVFRKYLEKNNCALEEAEPAGDAPVNIGLMGARCSQGVLDMIHNYNINVLFDMTCTGVSRRFEIPQELLKTGDSAAKSGAANLDVGVEDSDAENGEAAGVKDSGTKTEMQNSPKLLPISPLSEVGGRDFELLEAYAGQLLDQLPCMRMNEYAKREETLNSYKEQLDGIIYHTVKFCDNYGFEYAYLYDKIDVPLQKFETDATSQCEGQIRTRVEAFLESILAAKGLQTTDIMKKKEEPRHRMNGETHVLGIDSGSTSTNAVIINQDREIEAYAIIRTGAKSGESADAILKEVLKKASLTRKDIDMIVSTGYGRVSIPFADRNVTEISCHGKGAHYFYPDVRTVLDIGGQDSKAIRLNEKGDVVDFVMNDKCAAGTGRFLEMMARTLEIDIDELGPESLKWRKDLDISSMCSVFAESEVISLIANNHEKCDIAHGIHKAIANKSVSLMKRVGLEPGYMMTGGVAKNPGAVREIEEKLGAGLFICDEPEIVGATGAAIFGLEELQSGAGA